jgi:putative membrane protein
MWLIALARRYWALEPDHLWSAWNWEPAITAGLILTGLLYAAGVIRFWRVAGMGRSLPLWRVGCFAAGLLVIGFALLSPLDSLAEGLFSAHMVQHLLLMLAAPALLVVGAPSRVLLWSLPAGTRRSVGLWWNRRRVLQRLITMLTQPAVAWSISVLALLVWHVPGWYQAALRSDTIHALEHLSFLLTGFLFWWVVLRPDARRRMSEAVSVLYVFTAALPGGLLGALLTFAGKPLYASQSVAARLWGLTPLEDQQLAGLIMWMPGGLVYLGSAAAFFLVWLRQDEINTYRRGVITAALGALLVLGLGGCNSRARPMGSDWRWSIPAAVHRSREVQ